MLDQHKRSAHIPDDPKAYASLSSQFEESVCSLISCGKQHVLRNSGFSSSIVALLHIEIIQVSDFPLLFCLFERVFALACEDNSVVTKLAATEPCENHGLTICYAVMKRYETIGEDRVMGFVQRNNLFSVVCLHILLNSATVNVVEVWIILTVF